MDSPKQRAIEALKQLKRYGPVEYHCEGIELDPLGEYVLFEDVLSLLNSQPDHGAPDALISAGEAMRRSLLGAIPVGPLDKWELDAFNALSDWDAAKAAAPRPHGEPSEEGARHEARVKMVVDRFSAAVEDRDFHFTSTQTEKVVMFPAEADYCRSEVWKDAIERLRAQGWNVKHSVRTCVQGWFNAVIVEDRPEHPDRNPGT